MVGRNDLLRQAGERGRAGDHQAAVLLYRQAIEIDEHDADSWFNLGNALRALGRLEEAAAPYRRATALSPGRAQAWLHLSGVLEPCGHAIDAEAAARRALALEPGDPIALIVLGRALVRQGRHHDAIACLEQALELQPDSIPALLEMAAALERWQMPEAAIRFYQRVIAREPGHAFSLARMIDLKLALCDWQDYDVFVADLAAQIEANIAGGGPIAVEIVNLHSMPIPPALAFAVARAKCAGFARRAAANPLAPAAPMRHGGQIGRAHV